MPQKKILIADFFGTVKTRGIAAYVKDLEAISRPLARTKIVRAPNWVSQLPQFAQNILMVLHEQLVMPFIALFYRPDLVIFPYNSTSFILSASSRTVCVIHDLIPYKSKARRGRISFAFAYISCSVRWHTTLRRRILAVSPYTARVLAAIPRFARSEITVIPNCFATFPQGHLPIPVPGTMRRVTLISGVGPNKAFDQAIKLMSQVLSASDLRDIGFDVVGFGAQNYVAQTAIDSAVARGVKLPQVTVHPLLSRSDLDELIANNVVVWAHSTAEGFGRVVAEGRLAGRPVVMSQLAVFRALSDDFTFSYHNANTSEFIEALRAALRETHRTLPYRKGDDLRAAATCGMRYLLAQ